MIQYINNPEPSRRQIQKAQPNSWSPLTKLDIAYSINQANNNRPMPMLQVFSRIPPRAMNIAERGKMWQGNYEGFGRIAYAGIEYVNEIRRNEGKKEITKAHFFGAGMAQRALAAAGYGVRHEDQYGIQVSSATAMNLALRRGFFWRCT